MEDKNQIVGLNASYVEILRSQWQQDPLSVPEEWRDYFSGVPQSSLSSQASEKQPALVKEIVEGEKSPLVGIAKKIVDNMESSLAIPTATSTRDLPVKVLEENRAIINDYLGHDAQPKCSFTHLVAYAIVKALKAVPALNNGFVRESNNPVKLNRKDINLGIAIDLASRDGGRTLVVPNIKACQNMDFWTFFVAYNDVVDRARQNKLKPTDFEGTTVSLTNPGGIGTVASIPRLMPGQGAIIATGRIGYPAEYEATAPETLQALGIGKVMTLTSTYDHRVIQGAESGRFLAHVHQLLIGEQGFYDEVFQALKIPHHPYKLKQDQAVTIGQKGLVTESERAMRVSQLIHAYRVRGYLLANVDPLDLKPREHPELELEHYGLTIWDLDREFHTLGVLTQKTAPFRAILQTLRDAYCRRIGVEYMYISDVEQKSWLQKRVEQQKSVFSIQDKKHILSKLTQAEEFEHFLHKRFVGHKRFSVEGGEAVIAMLDSLLNLAAKHGATDVMLGMAHRGRLNVLANTVGKPYAAIFGEFDDIDPKTIQGSGDVKYHLGARGIHRWKGVAANGDVDERTVRVELSCNPSHLEAVGPVVEGQARARQDLSGDKDRQKVMPVLLHGDAAFACQGVVYETLQLSNLQGYRTGGTIHIVINNQIGYTTPPEKGRSSINCSDIARALSIPVFRVNGDDPEACLRAIEIAAEYRMKFSRDVVIDLVCYRRHGHNEGDEPSFTQPILYRAIQSHPSVANLYGELLIRRGDITKEEWDAICAKHVDELERALEAVRSKGHEAFSTEHVLFPPGIEVVTAENPETSVSLETLKRIGEKVTYDPEAIEIHPRVITQVLQRRRAMVEGKVNVDFGMAEILAYGSLLLEGIPVRISGQDCGRGTFAHRHAVLYDVNDGRPYIPLRHLDKTLDEGESVWHPSRFRIYDSPLSEEAVLGFEYGYSVTHPTSLVIWEAQFGDFFNGAQIQIDQFIASSESKWGQKSRVALFLPHGYDGQGPEHSSGRVERFLQLCANDNMRVAICSTPAQLFHLLRRQAKQPKKPLVVFSHKSLLRAEDASSKLEELADGSFAEVIDDLRVKNAKKVKRLAFCTGKIYWEADRMRVEKPENFEHVALVRVEQLYPFPTKLVMQAVKKYAPEEVVWLQEEPANNGAYMFVDRYFRRLGINVRYIGREDAASPATGSPKAHKRQQKVILDAVFAEYTKNADAADVLA